MTTARLTTLHRGFFGGSLPGETLVRRPRVKTSPVRVGSGYGGPAGDAQNELRSLAVRLDELGKVRAQAAELQDRMLASAEAALARGDEAEARRALGRKLQAGDIVRDTEAKMAALRGEEVRLRDYQVISELREAFEEDDRRLLSGSEPPSPDAEDMELAAFLPALSVELAKLRAAREINGALGAVELVPALMRLGREQQKALARHEAASLEALLALVSTLAEPGSGAQQPGSSSLLWAAQLLEAVYQGRAMVELFCEETSREAAGALEVLEFRGSSEVDQPAFCVLLDREAEALHVTVRGLDSLKDALTAARATPTRLLDGLCHQGAMVSSQWLLGRIRPLIKTHRPRELRMYGHSLGGAVAAAAAVQLTAPVAGDRALPDGCKVSAVAFGPPPCFGYGLELRRAADSHVAVVVNGADCVSWLSESNASTVLRVARGLAGRAARVPPLPTRRRAEIREAAGQQMLLPGRVTFLDGVQGLYSLVPSEPEAFVGTIPLTDRCISDHRLHAYVKALSSALGG